MFTLAGRKALVTGASGAIGKSIAVALAGQGAQVALSGTRVDALNAVAAAIPGSVVVPGDLGAADGVDAVFAAAEKALGEVDILVNNAGLTRDGLALRMKDEDWQRVIDVDLTAAFKLSRAALKGMMRRRWGRIVSITSIVGVTGNPGQANYAAAKAGLIGMSKALAQEMAARGITVNCVAPGFIVSPMTDVLPDAQKDALKARIPVGRIGEPAEIAAAVAFLASTEAAYITGQTLHVNGGMAMI
ncbi:MAG: 3-oxoacyl-[acyl-carrier-protein] reductase [Alphaproteobacteria bacterium]|nr:3-oxoacyl-[acyl-carrier-protein] reductase [Alphaproteobacteria bacterium]